MKYLSLATDVKAVAEALGIQSYKIKEKIEAALSVVGINYPNFEDWFGKIFVEALREDTRRDIVLAIEGTQIAGVLILKDMDGEKKICTLVVLPSFRKQGIGNEFFEIAFDYLGTRKPSLSIAQDIVPSMASFIRKFKFKLTNIDQSYNKNKAEFYYN